MKNLVTIKSFKNGLSIILDNAADFTDLRQAVADKFKEASGFFKDAKMAISFENRTLSEEEEKVNKQKESVLAAAKELERAEVELTKRRKDENSQVEVLCVIGKNEATEKQFLKALTQLEEHVASAGNMAQIYKGNVKNHKRVEISETIVILGDVNPGCVVNSDKDIIVLGGLYGQANAGRDEKEGHFVIALEMAPERLTINHYSYHFQDKHKWGIKQKVQPKIAYETAGEISVDTVSREVFQRLVSSC